MPPPKKTPARAAKAQPEPPAPTADPYEEKAVDYEKAVDAETKPPRPGSITLTTDVLTDFAEQFGRALTIDDLADAGSIDRDQLRAANIGVLDAEAAARGHDHSDNGRLLFAGTVLTLPQDGG